MKELLIQIFFSALVILFALVIGYGLWRLIQIPTRRWRESAFDYVYVDDEGIARELSAEEEEYLTAALFPEDEARFFVKPRYESRGPHGKLRGYLRRRQLPRKASVGPPPIC